MPERQPLDVTAEIATLSYAGASTEETRDAAVLAISDRRDGAGAPDPYSSAETELRRRGRLAEPETADAENPSPGVLNSGEGPQPELGVKPGLTFVDRSAFADLGPDDRDSDVTLEGLEITDGMVSGDLTIKLCGSRATIKITFPSADPLVHSGSNLQEIAMHEMQSILRFASSVTVPSKLWI